jgi:hypothetical protein
VKPPTHRVNGIAYCDTSRLPVLRQQPKWGSPEEGAQLIETLADLYDDIETHIGTQAMTAVAGSGELWYVVGLRAADSVTVKLSCQCHAREMARDLFSLAHAPDERD